MGDIRNVKTSRKHTKCHKPTLSAENGIITKCDTFIRPETGIRIKIQNTAELLVSSDKSLYKI